MNAVLLAVLAVVLLFLAIGSGLDVLFRLAYVAAGTLVVAFAWTRLGLRGITLSRQVHSTRARVGDVLSETLTVRNDSRLPKSWITFRDHSTLPGHRASRVVSMGGKEQATWHTVTPCQVRGRFRLGPATLSVADPFGLFQKRTMVAKATQVVVFPATVPLPHLRFPGGELSGGAARRQYTNQITPNAAGLREYAPGDAFGRIHWPSTARTGRLLVKEFEPDPVADMWIVLDMQASVQAGRGPDSTEEYAIHGAASVAKHFLDSGWAVGLLAWAEQRHELPPERGDRQLMKILEELAVIRANGLVPFGEVLLSESGQFGRYTAVFAVTSATDRVWVDALRSFWQRGVRSVALLVDGGSFGGGWRVDGLVSPLASAGIGAHIYRRNDQLADVFLADGSAGAA